MKRIVTVAMFAAGLLAVSEGALAQGCSNLTPWDLRGTYTLGGSGYMDPSKVLGGPSPGMVPYSFVAAVTYNGNGGGTGTVWVNVAGTQFTATLKNVKYTVNPDCSSPVSFSLFFQELNVTPPITFTRIFVVSGQPGALKLIGILAGAGAGTWVDSIVGERISMN